ncbi:hypothetical protein NL676_032474 [Syzygium grande]|nr:hypothetical protein NL676_032474 [Syzygium grande]
MPPLGGDTPWLRVIIAGSAADRVIRAHRTDKQGSPVPDEGRADRLAATPGSAVATSLLAAGTSGSKSNKM